MTYKYTRLDAAERAQLADLHIEQQERELFALELQRAILTAATASTEDVDSAIKTLKAKLAVIQKEAGRLHAKAPTTQRRTTTGAG